MHGEHALSVCTVRANEICNAYICLICKVIAVPQKYK